MLSESLGSTSISLGSTSSATVATDNFDLDDSSLFSITSCSIGSALLNNSQSPTPAEQTNFTQEYFASMSDEELNNVLDEIAIIEEKDDVKQLKKTY